MLSFGSAFLSRYDRAEDRAEEGRRTDRLFNVQCDCSARSAIPPLDDFSRLYAVIFQRSSRSASCPASHIVVSSLVQSSCARTGLLRREATQFLVREKRIPMTEANDLFDWFMQMGRKNGRAKSRNAAIEIFMMSGLGG